MSEHEIWLIYSREHNAWWRPKAAGYTVDMASAGRYDREAAHAHCNTRDQQRDGSVSEFMVPDPDEMDSLQALNSDLLAALKAWIEHRSAVFDAQMRGKLDEIPPGRIDEIVEQAEAAIKAAEKQSAGEQS